MSALTLTTERTSAPEDRGTMPAVTDLDGAARVFLAERAQLLRVARRVVHDAAAAEDVVQDAWLRWQRADRTQIRNPAAFLTTVTTHLAINVVQSARHRHELPTEVLPAIVAPADDPGEHAERAAAVERTLALMLTRLSPAELAAYLLRTCFEHPYDEIAAALATSPANARQLVRRGHLALTGHRSHPVDPQQHRHLTAAFTHASTHGDLAPLVRMLSDAARQARRSPARPHRPAHPHRLRAHPIRQAASPA